MEESDQLHAEVILPQRKNNQVPTEHKERWEAELVWTLLRRGKSPEPARNRITILPSSSPAHKLVTVVKVKLSVNSITYQVIETGTVDHTIEK
jgi:hypothetical protein